MAIQAVGKPKDVVVGPSWIEAVAQSGARTRMEFISSNIVRVRFSASGTFKPRPTGSLAASPKFDPFATTIDDNGVRIQIASTLMRLEYGRESGMMDLYWADGSEMLRDAPDPFVFDLTSGLILARKNSAAKDHYVGLGPRGGPTDRRGRKFIMSNTDRFAYGPLTDPLYISTPYFYTFQNGRAFSIYIDSGVQQYIDFGADQPTTLAFGTMKGDLDYYLLAGPAPATVARNYAELTGYCPMPPKWSLGYHQSRYSYYSQQELIDVATKLRDLSIPADVLWLDIDYMDRFHQFTWDKAKFPEPEKMNAQLEDMGFKRINISEPCVLKTDPTWQSASDAGFFLTGPDGETLVNNIWFGDVSWLDFSRRPARYWYKERLKRFVASGISGLWNDLNEPAQNNMPEAVYDYNGQKRTDIEARNLYALEMTKAAYEAMRELRPNERPWMISRSGFPGIHRYSANWSGDANSDWEALRTNLQMTIAVGISGQQFFGHDTGGFLGSPDGELFTRWLQFSEWTALFRNHSMNDVERREPWAYAEPWFGHIKRIIENRYAMMPTVYSWMERATRSSEPFVSPLPYHFPAEEATFAVDDQYMFGDRLMVAPITEPGKTSRDVYFPGRGRWVEIHSNVEYLAGRKTNVPAPIDYIPVFAAEGAQWVRQAVVQHLGQQVSPDLQVDIYPGQDSVFTLYEDDGHTLNYTRKEFVRTLIRLTHGVDGLAWITSKDAGEWNLTARNWSLRFHRISAVPRAVTLNGSPLAAATIEGQPGWRFDAQRKQLLVLLLDTGSPMELRIRP